MTTKDKTIFGAVVVVITLLIGWGVNNLHFGSQGVTLGSVGNLLAENYIAYVRQNGGYNSQFPITTSGVLIASGGISSTGTLTVGSSGTAISRINTGTCYMAPIGATIAASTTIAIDCQATALVGQNGESALTGVTSGDNVSVQLSTTTAQVTSDLTGLFIAGANASTTSGYITLRLQNRMGTTFTWPTSGTASGTASYIVTH